MGIPKYPTVPPLTRSQIEEMTSITFYKEVAPKKSDAIFVFGGSHSGNWIYPLKAYNEGFAETLIITGGSSSWGITHSEWKKENKTESEFITSQLIKYGVPEKAIHYENTSRHSIENVQEALMLFDFDKIDRLLFVCKSYGTGRQYLTLKKYLPAHIECIPFPFDTNFNNEPIMTRSNWYEREQSRSLVFGEYLRIISYGSSGAIFPIEQEIHGLTEHTLDYLDRRN
ncbi:YdcF family protein [Alkalicoccobacillus murimartini]|uniref:Uncharacterized SAM-binding protein YcdF (DUF218 family) n=1 Tax=Alkalicoccobacillus murimartini TaxID=171685 RepID=A0ABT9YCZ9_9BACI|nr:YdcF family protein [Alkalicoccobacillus murimartini]MDQ0205697.1 uncharacterized SAM-binding protein YcdF (DUF218 family) [Alkalicoccobacillus murimartini]